MDFGQRISDAQSTKNASYGTYNQYAGQANQAYDKYNQNFDSQKGYGDIYNEARQQFVDTPENQATKNTYLEARNAVDQINTTLNKMPESIKQQYGGTGMTEAQRQRALQSQMGAMQNTQNYATTNYTNASQDYNTAMARALTEAGSVAQGTYGQQQDKLNALQSSWSTLLGQRNTAYNAYQQDLSALAGQYGARDDWNLQQQNMELERWKEQQANARAAADRNSQYAIQKYLADAQTAGADADRSFQTEMMKQQRNAGRLADATLASDKANAAAKAAQKEFGTGNFVTDYGNSIAKYGPLALFGKGWGW